MKLEISKEELFELHGELNQIHGVLMAVIDSNKKLGINFSKNATVKKCYPEFWKILRKVNDEMKQYKLK